MLSIIIPAYNEEKNIKNTLTKLFKSLDNIDKQLEVIVVCDGCKDNTAQKAREIKNSHLKVLEYSKNQGKGYALAYGAKKSNGRYITLLDAGGDFDASSIDKFVKLMEIFDADIVIGSKRHPASQVKYPLRRKIYSWFYSLLIRMFFNLNIRDTQVGFKVFRRDVLLNILPRAVVKRYAFDLELLVIAKRLGYSRIFEAPVKMNFNFSTSSVNFKAIFNMFLDTLAIFYRANFLKYYDKIHLRIKD